MAFGPPAPPPSPDALGTPGLRFDGPPRPPNLALNVAPTALNDIVLQTAPLPIDLGPIEGFADLHIHQMANLGFDGRLVWGAYDGPDEESAVPQCSGMVHALCWIPGAVFDATGIHEWEVGSHAGLSFPQIPCVSSLLTGGPGASTKGWHGNATSQRFSARHLCAVMPAFNGLLGASDFDAVTPAGITNPTLDLAIRTAGPCNDMRNVRRQLLAAWQFDADHWYEIALTPGQAAQSSTISSTTSACAPSSPRTSWTTPSAAPPSGAAFSGVLMLCTPPTLR